MRHVEFAERARRRLEAVAVRLDGEDAQYGDASGAAARVQELRVAALLVRDEATAVGRAERERYRGEPVENLPLEAQG